MTPVGNYGFFATNFTPKSCQHFFWAAPILKGINDLTLQQVHEVTQLILPVIQTMISQAILGIR